MMNIEHNSQLGRLDLHNFVEISNQSLDSGIFEHVRKGYDAQASRLTETSLRETFSYSDSHPLKMGGLPIFVSRMTSPNSSNFEFGLFLEAL